MWTNVSQVYVYISNRSTDIGLSKEIQTYSSNFCNEKKTGIFKNMLYLYNGMLQINKMNKTLLMNWFLKKMLNKKYKSVDSMIFW